MCIASLINCLLALLYLVIGHFLHVRLLIIAYFGGNMSSTVETTPSTSTSGLQGIMTVHLGSLPRFMKDLCQDN